VSQKLDSPEQETKLVPVMEDPAAAWEIYKGLAPDPVIAVRESLGPAATPEMLREAYLDRAEEIRGAYYSFREVPPEDQPVDLYKMIGATAQLETAAGKHNEIPDDLREAADRLVSELNEYVVAQGPLPYTQAESEMARTLARQIMGGSKEIDLSQHYATDDSAVAAERHQQALYNLMPLIRDAARNGYQIEFGQAATQSIKQKEVLAISNSFKISNGI
jgi:hypothetical protein